MQFFSKELNGTALALARKALKSLRLDAMFGKYEWVGEVDKSTWCSTCKALQKSALFESNEAFQRYMKANQLCFTHRESKEDHVA